MADKTVKTHTNVSNREKPQGKKQQATQEKKVVFKSVLDNPYRIQWPKVAANVQNLVLSHALSMLEGMGEYTTGVRERNHKRKRVERAANKEVSKKRRRISKKVDISAEDAMETAPDAPVASTSIIADVVPQEGAEKAMDDLSRPPVYGHVVAGINNVTKRLEKQTERVRYPPAAIVKAASTAEQPVESSAQRTEVPPSPLRLVLVCKADVDPPILIDHIPHLVAAHNSSTAADAPIKLLCLPRGAELAIADALGIRRVAVLAFDADTPGLSQLDATLDSVPTLAAAWLTCKPHLRNVPSMKSAGFATPAYIPTHVKQLKITAPKDMRAAKERRTNERKEAKTRKKEQVEKVKEAMQRQRAPMPWHIARWKQSYDI